MSESPTDQADEQPGPGDTEQINTLNPFPDLRDLYLIIAGIVVGILLSGAVLGNIAPNLHQRLFVGGMQVQKNLEELREDKREQIEALKETDVSPVAVKEKLAAFDARDSQLLRQLKQDRQAHQRWLMDRMTALVLAILAVMVLEAVVSPPLQRGAVSVPSAVSRLVTVRYALIAVWVAMAVAQPAILRGVPMLFTALVIAIALAVAFIPLGKRSMDAAATHGKNGAS